MSAPTVEQSVMLAALEQKHGTVHRIPEDSSLAEQLLGNCVSDTRAYRCIDCDVLFTIEPDGETGVWTVRH